MFDQFIDFALLAGKSLDNFMHYFRWQPNTSSKASKIVLFDFVPSLVWSNFLACYPLPLVDVQQLMKHNSYHIE